MNVTHINSKATLQGAQFFTKTNVITAVMLIALGCGIAYYFSSCRSSEKHTVMVGVQPRWEDSVGATDMDINAKILNIVSNKTDASYPFHKLNIKFIKGTDKPSAIRVKFDPDVQLDEDVQALKYKYYRLNGEVKRGTLFENGQFEHCSPLEFKRGHIHHLRIDVVKNDGEVTRFKFNES